MTQAEFSKWLDSVLGGVPMDELVSPEVLEHMNRVHLENESRAWNFARMEDQPGFETTVRAMVKTMFAVGYAAGREQGDIDSLFGGGSALDGDADSGPDSDEDNSKGGTLAA